VAGLIAQRNADPDVLEENPEAVQCIRLVKRVLLCAQSEALLSSRHA
jgi:hypothetical protein